MVIFGVLHGWNSRRDRWMDFSMILKDILETRLLPAWQQQQQQQQQAKRDHGFDNDNGIGQGSRKRSRTNSTAGEPKHIHSSHNDPSSTATMTSTTMTTVNNSSSGKTDTSTVHGGYYSPRHTNFLFFDSCELPFTLKAVLVEEYECITRCGYNSPHGYND